MKRIRFDSGVRSYALGNGVLRFNPTDPNVYVRFSQAVEKLPEIFENLTQGAGDTVTRLEQADQELKKLLGTVFGPENDFHALLGGVNLLAVGENGERVILNLFSALEPILLEGAEQCAQTQVQGAVQKARQRRETQ